MKIKSEFIKDSIILSSGTALSQIVLVMSVPLITRLYSPEELGLWSLAISVSAILLPILTLRFDMAIVLPKNRQLAVNLMVMSSLICMVFFFFLVSLVLTTLYFEYDDKFLFFSKTVLLYVSLIALLMAIGQILNYWCIRKKRFSTISLSKLVISFFTVIVQIFLALSFFEVENALLIGTVVGYFASIIVLIVGAKVKLSVLSSDVSFKKIVYVTKKYRNFPFYNLPYSFMSTFGQKSTIVFLGLLSSTQAVGYFAMAMKLTLLPVSIFAAALNQVFYQRAARVDKLSSLDEFVVQVLRMMVAFGLPLLILLIDHMEQIFHLVLGPSWRIAGLYASWLLLPSYMLFITSWLDRIYDVTSRQRLALQLESGYIILTVFILWSMLTLYDDPLVGISIYSLFTVLYNVYWLVVTFRIAGFSLLKLYSVFGYFLKVLACFLLLYFFLMQVFVDTIGSGFYVLVCIILGAVYIKKVC